MWGVFSLSILFFLPLLANGESQAPLGVYVDTTNRIEIRVDDRDHDSPEDPAGGELGTLRIGSSSFPIQRRRGGSLPIHVVAGNARARFFVILIRSGSRGRYATVYEARSDRAIQRTLDSMKGGTRLPPVPKNWRSAGFSLISERASNIQDCVQRLRHQRPSPPA